MGTLWGLNVVTICPTPLGRGFQIGTIRPIRVDHTDFSQVDIKIHSFTLVKVFYKKCTEEEFVIGQMFK
jgi:hypothetical protein